MSTIVLFHSGLGLRPAVLRFADALRAAGHAVHTPDLFDGEVFDDLDAGIAKRDAIGVPGLIERAFASVAELPSELVYAGFSLGAAAAQTLAVARPGARGALLLEGAVPLEYLEVDAWPAAVPLRIEVSRDDAWADLADAQAVVASAPEGVAELVVHEGGGHLVCDEDLRDHDPVRAAAMLKGAVDWLARVDAAG